MGYKKKVFVILICIFLLFSLSLSAFALEYENSILFGVIFRVSSDGEQGSWSKLTTSEDFTVGGSVPAGEFLQSMSFVSTGTESFNVGYTYEFEIEVHFLLAELNGYFFSASESINSDSWSHMTASVLSSAAGSRLSDDIVQSSYNRDSDIVKVVFRPDRNYKSLVFRCIQVNSSSETQYLRYQFSNMTATWDADGSYYQKQTNQLLEQTNGKLDDVNNNLEEGNQKLDDIQKSIENSSENEYNFIEGKKGESDAEEDAAQAELDEVLDVDGAMGLIKGLDALCKNTSTSTSITFPSATLPDFAGGKKLWDETTIDFSKWLDDPNVEKILSVAKYVTAILALVAVIRMLWGVVNVDDNSDEEGKK